MSGVFYLWELETYFQLSKTWGTIIAQFQDIRNIFPKQGPPLRKHTPIVKKKFLEKFWEYGMFVKIEILWTTQC